MRRGHVKVVKKLLKYGKLSPLPSPLSPLSCPLSAVPSPLSPLPSPSPFPDSFLRIGADIEVSYRDGVTALVMACYRGNEEMVQYLLSRRANIQTRYKTLSLSLSISLSPFSTLHRCDTHATPLHVAALAGYASVAEMLLKRGADVNTVKENGQSALHSACKGGHQKVNSSVPLLSFRPLFSI